MSQPIDITVDQDGTVRFLLVEGAEAFLDGNALVRRASHVQPVNPIIRWVFFSLRHYFGEKGWMASFTRLWPVLWEVNLSPIGGPILDKVYCNRDNAINAEVEWINANFI